MSIASWKKEFYKTGPANQAAANSLKKWEGLRPVNLKKHELRKVKYNNTIENMAGRGFNINQTNCELCKHFYSTQTGCDTCPIKKATGTDCFDEFRDWTDYGGVSDMIKLLKKAVKKSEESV